MSKRKVFYNSLKSMAISPVFVLKFIAYATALGRSDRVSDSITELKKQTACLQWGFHSQFPYRTELKVKAVKTLRYYYQTVIMQQEFLFPVQYTMIRQLSLPLPSIPLQELHNLKYHMLHCTVKSQRKKMDLVKEYLDRILKILTPSPQNFCFC